MVDWYKQILMTTIEKVLAHMEKNVGKTSNVGMLFKLQLFALLTAIADFWYQL